VIADRRHLAQQFKQLRQQINELNEWIDNPDMQFPGDAVIIADELGHLRELMLADYDTPDAVRGARAQLADALTALLAKDQRWEGVPSPDCMTVTRRWPDGTVDTLVIRSVLTAHGRRNDAREHLVWVQRGTMDHVVAAAGDLPDPSTLDAPKERNSVVPSGHWP
jgi:hypothetical protein